MVPLALESWVAYLMWMLGFHGLVTDELGVEHHEQNPRYFGSAKVVATVRVVGSSWPLAVAASPEAPQSSVVVGCFAVSTVHSQKPHFQQPD
mgnify:CR=1 FL=1